MKVIIYSPRPGIEPISLEVNDWLRWRSIGYLNGGKTPCIDNTMYYDISDSLLPELLRATASADDRYHPEIEEIIKRDKKAWMGYQFRTSLE